jgi:hypothetical protein
MTNQTPTSALIYERDNDGKITIDLCGSALEDESGVLDTITSDPGERGDDLLARHGWVRGDGRWVETAGGQALECDILPLDTSGPTPEQLATEKSVAGLFSDAGRC